MNDKQHQPGLIRNWISLIGIPLAAFGFAIGIALIVLDILSPLHSPYLGIFTYLVVPVILIVGLLMILAGVLLERRRRIRTGRVSLERMPIINLNMPRQRYAFITVIVVAFLFFTLSGIGGYRAYHFSESVTFCGLTCHTVMKPEYTAFQNSPHANVTCTKCHIGPGAGWFVKSKLNGLYQVYSTTFDKYHRPIEAPVKNLRPAAETCYTCHWPEKFFGTVERTRTHHATDEANTPWTIRMLVKVGGGKGGEHGQVEGSHWHMISANKIEYIAADEKRQVIPWVRRTDAEGNVTVYQTSESGKALTEADVAAAEIRTLDCIDCHNRPTHHFNAPARSLDVALSTGNLDIKLASIKSHALDLLTDDYETEEEALAAIEAGLRKAYPDGGGAVEQAIRTVTGIYKVNFFPEMKVSWLAYPDNIGHFEAPGCARCHDGLHASEDGKTINGDCMSCHIIIAQGPGPATASISPDGLAFEHPGDLGEFGNTITCYECHGGAP